MGSSKNRRHQPFTRAILRTIANNSFASTLPICNLSLSRLDLSNGDLEGSAPRQFDCLKIAKSQLDSLPALRQNQNSRKSDR